MPTDPERKPQVHWGETSISYLIREEDVPLYQSLARQHGVEFSIVAREGDHYSTLHGMVTQIKGPDVMIQVKAETPGSLAAFTAGAFGAAWAKGKHDTIRQ